LPGKAVPEMTYTVTGGTINLTHSLTVCMWRHRWRLYTIMTSLRHQQER